MSNLALFGGTPVRTAPYPAWPVYDDHERELLLEVLDSRRWWAMQGTKVSAFEREFGQLCDGGSTIAVTNGTHTLEVALQSLGVGAGDEVIVPDWTFFATMSAVFMVNAIPVPVDVDPHTGCLDPAAVEAAITPRTAAIIPVHVAGHPADLDRLLEICARHQLALIEDCAHAHGSRWNDRSVGTFGDVGSFSFQASKLMTAGEGGAIVTTRPDIAERARSFINCGRRPDEWYYNHYLLGGNYRMTEWQGAVLLAQIARFPAQQAERAANADYLNAELAKITGVYPQRRDPRCTAQANYCYLVRIDPKQFGADRDSVREALLAEGMELTTAYPPLHRLAFLIDPDGLAPRFRSRVGLPDYAHLPLPETDKLATTTLWFTTSVLMGSRADATDVIEAVARVQQHARELTHAH